MRRRLFIAVSAVALALISLFASCGRDVVDVDTEETLADTDSAETVAAENGENTMKPDIIVDTGVDEDSLVPSDEAKKWIDAYDLKFGSGAAEKVILGTNEIKNINAGMISLADYMVDVRDFSEAEAVVTDNKLREWLGAEIPYAPCYKEDGSAYSDAEITQIYANRDVEKAGQFVISRGIVVERADMRTVPHGDIVLKAPDNMPYDRIQETELVVGMPVWILHESADGMFYYVQSYYYRGWVRKSSVATVSDDEDWEYFTEPERFVVVTEKLLEVDGRYADMGVVFPLEAVSDRGYEVCVPCADGNGALTGKIVIIERTSAYEGYVPYTMANFYTQAFKYMGTIYGWGGMDNGVDCSSFVCSVMRSFGFEMPRNTSQQNKIMCSPISLSELSDGEKSELFEKLDAPAALFSSGHVTLVLGEMDGRYYIIHAPSAGNEVCTAEISVTDTKYTYIAIMKGN